MIEMNALLLIFLAFYFLQVASSLWLEKLNLDHLKRRGNQVPPSFEGFIDESKLSQITAYSIAKSRPGFIHEILTESILLAMILFGFFTGLQQYLLDHRFSYFTCALLFFLAPGLVFYVVDLPFEYHQTFVVEEKFGFNRSTLKLWISDQVKSGLISLVLFTALLFIVLGMVKVSPENWWLWSFLIVSAVQILLAVLYPVVIAPLFNKFEPVKDDLLSRKITRLMEQNGIRVKRILQMNAGVRSRHSNAYFTGLGKTKQIVLFDTLLDAHPHDEILSVLAHEVGHFKKRHILKQIISMEAALLVGFYLVYRLIDWPELYTAFGFKAPVPYVGFFLIGLFWQRIGFFLQPLFMAMSRRFERQADGFAVRFLNTGRPLATALKRMAAENLSNLAPHPLYVRFHYSHPPLLERVSRLEASRGEEEGPPDSQLLSNGAFAVLPNDRESER